MLGISQSFASILGFFFLIYLARYLGEVDFGKYCFATSLTTLFSIIIGLGINNLMIRELARHRELIEEYVSNAIILKLILSVAGFLLFFFAAKIFNFSGETFVLLCLFYVYTVINSLAQVFRSAFQGFERMEFEALIAATDQSILLIFIAIIISERMGLIEIGSAYILVGLINLALGYYIVEKYIHKLKLSIDILMWRRLISESIPFGLNSLFALLFFKIDTLMLSFFQGDAAVGIYNAAYTPLLSLGIIPSILITALFPVMSRYFASSNNNLEILTLSASRYLAIIGFPMAIGCLVLADGFVNLLYNGQYVESVLAFEILAIFIPIRWINVVAGNLLTSADLQSARTISVGISSLLNIILNLIMIPRFSYVGASIATVISEFFLYIIFNYWTNKRYKPINLHLGLAKPAMASLIMGIIILNLHLTNLLLNILLASIIYLITLLIIGGVSNSDKILIEKLLIIYYPHFLRTIKSLKKQ